MTSKASGTVRVISMRRTPLSARSRAVRSAMSALGTRTTATMRSSEKIRTPSRRVTSGRCVSAIASTLPVDGPIVRV